MRTKDEESLRIHIRQLLFRYVKANIAVDYVQWEEEAVGELLLECLRKVPEFDPTSLWIPPEPFDTLKQLYKLSRLPAYEERWQTSPHALDFLKNAIKCVPGRSRSDTAPLIDDPDLPEFERMEEPELTIRSIRETPRLPSTSRLKIMQKGPFHLSEGIKLIENEDPDEASLQGDRILNVNWQMSSSERQDVRTLLKATFDFSGRIPSYSKAILDFHNERDIEVACEYRSASPFMPLFPRKLPIGYKKGATAEVGTRLNSFAELSVHLSTQISTEELEKDLFNENMKVIDDWGVCQISSPSTPSSSQEDRKIALLFDGSSPNTEPCSVEVLEAAKMDIAVIPRSRRPGMLPKQKSVMGGESFTSFILKALPGTKEPTISGLWKHDGEEECATSLAGEPPCSGGRTSTAAIDETKGDDGIQKLYAGMKPSDFWFSETLDQKGLILMEGKHCHET
ncbi:hypothetical protein AX15_003390 [Amanita polypyramis BW_CC]|nr:hypothetical protein AX15_003390 [Amanita polypyramis BW_CC]